MREPTQENCRNRAGLPLRRKAGRYTRDRGRCAGVLSGGRRQKRHLLPVKEGRSFIDSVFEDEQQIRGRLLEPDRKPEKVAATGPVQAGARHPSAQRDRAPPIPRGDYDCNGFTLRMQVAGCYESAAQGDANDCCFVCKLTAANLAGERHGHARMASGILDR